MKHTADPEDDEIESANFDQDEYEEETGTTPQDIYNERNAHSLRQSDMIEIFRSEY